MESRSGLHDIAAATVTDLNADVLLFAVDSDGHWTDYDVLFRQTLAETIRERLAIVSALTPELNKTHYLQRFREKSWNLFRELLYDDVAPTAGSGGEFSFDLLDSDAPHDPIPIDWNRGLATGTSLLDPDWTTVKLAYTGFLQRFDELGGGDNGGGSM